MPRKKAEAATPEIKPGKYWIGTTEHCPKENIALGGICFPRKTQKVEYDKTSGTTLRSERTGDIIDLNADRIKAIKKAIKDRVVRWAGDRSRGWIYDSAHKYYTKFPQDEPLVIGVHIFMKPVSEDFVSGWTMVGAPPVSTDEPTDDPGTLYRTQAKAAGFPVDETVGV